MSLPVGMSSSIAKARVYLFESTGDCLAWVSAEGLRLRLNDFHSSVQ
jgi:hypothetical protein